MNVVQTWSRPRLGLGAHVFLRFKDTVAGRKGILLMNVVRAVWGDVAGAPLVIIVLPGENETLFLRIHTIIRHPRALSRSIVSST